MFGISGDVGDDLLQTLAQQLAIKQQQEEMRNRAQQIAEQTRQFNEQMALSRQREENDQGRHRDEQALRTRVVDLDELRRRDQNNQTGLEQMHRDRQAWEGEQAARGLSEAANDPSLPPAVRTVVGLRARGVTGVSPSDVEDPATVRAADEARRKADLADFEQRQQIEARYRPTPREATRPGEGPPTQFALEHSQMVVDKVSKLLPRIGVTTAGPVGTALSYISGTEASDVAADLQSLAANIAFDQLQKMREASKTGGALGQVSDRETVLLQNVVASLQQKQTPAQLRRNLEEVQASAQRFLDAAGQVEKVGMTEPRMGRTGAPAPAPGGTTPRVLRFDRQGNPIP